MKVYKLRKKGTDDVFTGKFADENNTGEIYSSLRNVKIAMSVGVNYGRLSYGEYEIVEYDLIESKVIDYSL